MWVHFTPEELKTMKQLDLGRAPTLANLISKMETAIKEYEIGGDAILKAQAMYARDSDDNIEVDGDASVSVNDDGTWVQAWVWVPKED